jgi:hypothetical protein
MRRGTSHLLALLVATGSACAGNQAAQHPGAPPVRRVAADRLFELRSSFWLNLHHFLYVQARARMGRDRTRPEVVASLGDTAGLGERSAEERRAWEASIAHYERALAERDLTFDSAAVGIKDRLAEIADGSESRAALAAAGLDPELRAVLEDAAPLYRALWWPRHDAANRAWIESMRPLLQRHGDAIAAGVTRAVMVSWPATPIRVDVSAYTNWAGAYTTEHPAHIMISSTAEGYRGTLGLEMLFHEAMHTLEDSLASARTRARQTTGKRVPYDLVHAIIFYTAGEVTRRVVPAHTPYITAQGLRTRGSLARYFHLLERRWRPYLDARASFSDAFAAIVAEL